MSDSLTRPDWAADIKDLGRRLGNLERRTTPRQPAATPAAGMASFVFPILIYVSGVLSAHHRIVLWMPAAMGAGARASGEVAVGPIAFADDDLAYIGPPAADEFTVTETGFTLEATYNVRIGDATGDHRMWASTGSPIIPGGNPLPPVDPDWDLNWTNIGDVAIADSGDDVLFTIGTGGFFWVTYRVELLAQGGG